MHLEPQKWNLFEIMASKPTSQDMIFFGLLNYTRCHSNTFKKKVFLLPKIICKVRPQPLNLLFGKYLMFILVQLLSL